MIDDEVVTLWVARETGVLAALLSSADTPAAVADEADVPLRAARILTRALADRGYFEEVDGRYEPTNRTLGFLTKTDPRSVGATPHRVDLLDRIADLPDRIDAADGETPPTPDTDGWTANRLGAVAATDAATVRALVTAAVRERPGADHVLDVGGAPGTFAAEFASRGFVVTLCDTAEAATRSRAFLGPADVAVSERSLPPEEPLPDADLAFVPDLLWRFGASANRRLCEALAGSLAPDGVAVLVERLRDRSVSAPAVALSALATTAEGDAYAAGDLRGWLADAGFEVAEVRDVPGTDRQAVVGRLG